MREEIKKEFVRHFGKTAEAVYAEAPGRTNLIGEHIDYQGGHVLPVAVERVIGAWAVRRSDRCLRLYSLTYQQLFQGKLEELTYQRQYPWVNYILGVVEQLMKREIVSFGFDLAVGGNVPVASGLSSSAALEVCIASLLLRMAGTGLPPLEVVRLARRAENEFVGVNCGIMDQFSSYLCRKGHALLLNCATLKNRQVPLQLGQYCFLLVNTLKERSLLSSFYNQRVEQVNAALATIQKKKPEVRYLAELNVKELEGFRDCLNSVIFRRALHVVRENERVLKAVDFLQAGQVREFGELLYASHESLRDLYEISCDELDFIVDFSRRSSAVAGARLTGGGFGGCCLVLLKKEAVKDFQDSLKQNYLQRFQREPEFIEVETADGVYYRGNNRRT
ncbi:MAG TPA: galactokinase [bacterium]|nr:galactokinase [bacterium]